jgi:hypothetical protein
VSICVFFHHPTISHVSDFSPPPPQPRKTATKHAPKINAVATKPPPKRRNTIATPARTPKRRLTVAERPTAPAASNAKKPKVHDENILAQIKFLIQKQNEHFDYKLAAMKQDMIDKYQEAISEFAERMENEICSVTKAIIASRAVDHDMANQLMQLAGENKKSLVELKTAFIE